MSVSLDGFIAGPNDEVDRPFNWYFSGDVEIPIRSPEAWPYRANIRRIRSSTASTRTDRRVSSPQSQEGDT
jgi:hypothetical protein